jgi:hypothetical protein
MVTSIIDKDDVTQTTTRDILRTFFDFLRHKYDSIALNDASVTLMEKVVLTCLPF